MKRSTFSPAQITGILKEFDNGKTAEEITREHGVSLFQVKLYTMVLCNDDEYHNLI